MKLLIYFSGTGEDSTNRAEGHKKIHRCTISKDKCLSCGTKVIMGNRHHCRICANGYICGRCSPKRPDFHGMRVCQTCYQDQSNQHSTHNRSWATEQELDDDTMLLVINGCHIPDTGGRYRGIFADLEIICENLIRCFYPSCDGPRYPSIILRQEVLKTMLGGAYGGSVLPRKIRNRTASITPRDGEPLSTIVLTGFSRGAVTCLAFARWLHDNNIFTPVHMFVNQPVPGPGHMFTKSSVLDQNMDLSRFDNIISCQLILGSYDYDGTNAGERKILRQMVPKFSSETEYTAIMLPIYTHLTGTGLTEVYAKNYQYNFLAARYGIELGRFPNMFNFQEYRQEEIEQECKIGGGLNKRGYEFGRREKIHDMFGAYDYNPKTTKVYIHKELDIYPEGSASNTTSNASSRSTSRETFRDGVNPYLNDESNNAKLP